MTIPGDLPDTESRAEDSVECFFLIASYGDSVKRLRTAMRTVEYRVNVSPLLSDFFRVRTLDLGERPRRPSADSGAVDLIARELTSPGGDAEHHYFAVVMLDSSAAMADAVLRRCRAHPALSKLPARWLGLADADDRTPASQDNDALPPVQVIITKAGSWSPEALSTELLRYADHLLDRFGSGPQESVTNQQVRELRVLADEIAAGMPDNQHQTQETRIAAESAPSAAPVRWEGPVPAGYPPPTGGLPEPSPALAGAVPPPRDRPPSRLMSGLRAVGRFFVWIWRFIVRVWRARRAGPGPQPALAAVDSMVRLVLLVVVGDGRRDPVEESQGWSFQARVERALARVAAGFWVRPLSYPSFPRELLHPARPRAWAERPPANYSLDLPGALEAVVEALNHDVATLQGGSWKLGRPSVVFYFGRVPLADPRTVQVFTDLMTEVRPVVTWVVPSGSEDLIAPQLRKGAAIIGDRRGAATEVVRLLCDQLSTR